MPPTKFKSAFASRDVIATPVEKTWGAADGHHAGPPLPAGFYPGPQLAPLSALSRTVGGRHVAAGHSDSMSRAVWSKFAQFDYDLITTSKADAIKTAIIDSFLACHDSASSSSIKSSVFVVDREAPQHELRSQMLLII
jgi:hypothetical protein